MRSTLAAAGLFTLLLAPPAGAQAPAPAVAATPAPGPASVVATPVPAPTPDDGPVAVPEPTDKAMRYYHSGNVLWVVDTLIGFALPALFLFTGWSARIRDLARKVGRNWFFTIAVYFILFSIVTWILTLPWSYYVEFVRQHAYDLSNQTLGKWRPTP